MLKRSHPEFSVLFVCLGNICRSPMAEGAFRKAADAAGLNVHVDSVGTADYHIGEPPDPRAIAEAKKHGVDISAALGRQLDTRDFERFTHIFALDKANLAGIRARAPRTATASISLLMDVVPGREGEPVKDPYYGGETDFADTWAQISIAIDALVEKLKTEGAAALP
ncbi:low molecular weight protein-tyrosine-phosphatase [Erythrobacter sp.]|jgi:protein-tyrosine phosphatase|uniref:low molecular weight protein-tyrosine-phosphatase n=1 Tax=Erythrobacter sp. TaxID=1042 RepID=UPI002EB9C427|nr:low molecular weight protein-tyrosine-phosphatase [Erythrobacter sp.]